MVQAVLFVPVEGVAVSLEPQAAYRLSFRVNTGVSVQVKVCVFFGELLPFGFDEFLSSTLISDIFNLRFRQQLGVKIS